MAEADSLDTLEGLHQDLLAYCDNHRLENIDRLSHELNSRIDEFRQLLDRKPKNDQSRRKLAESKHKTLYVPPSL